jgi:flagellar motor switch protein FliN
MADEQNKKKTGRKKKDEPIRQPPDGAAPDDPVGRDRAPDDLAPHASPEEAVEAAEDAVGEVARAAAESGPAGLTDDVLAAARAAVAEAAAVASPPASQPAPTNDPPARQAPGPTTPSDRLDPLDLPHFESVAGADDPKGIDLLSDVNLNVSIELGRTRMLVEDVLRLSDGAVVELDKLAGDPVDVYVNERLVARGEVLVLNDTFCIRVNEIVKQGADAVAEAG